MASQYPTIEKMLLIVTQFILNPPPIVTTKWESHTQTKAESLSRDFKVLNKIALHNYATTAPVGSKIFN